MSLQLIRRILFRNSIYRYGHNYQSRPLSTVPPDNASGSKDPPGNKKELDLKEKAQESEQLENKVELQQKTQTSIEQEGSESKKIEEIKVEAQPSPSVVLEEQAIESKKVEEIKVEAQPSPSVVLEEQAIESKKVEEIKVEAQPSPSVVLEEQAIESKKVEEIKVEAQQSPAVVLEEQAIESKKVEEIKVEAQQSPAVVLEEQAIESKKVEEIKVEAQQSPAVVLEEQAIESKKVEEIKVEAQQSPEVLVKEQAVESKKSEEVKVEALQNTETPLEQRDTAPTQSIKDEKRAAAKKKLNDLLISLATADPVPVEPFSKLQLSKPIARPKRTKKEKQEQEKDVVSTPEPSPDIRIEPELVVAARDVAESLGGDVNTTESELLSTLKSHASETSLEEKPSVNLSELFVGMKVERSTRKPVVERKQYGRYDKDPSTKQQGSSEEESFYKRSWSSQHSRSRDPINVDLRGGKKLGIFDLKSLEEIKSKGEGSYIGENVLPVWQAVHQREMQLSVTHPPTNAFQEMIQWTKQGKLWTFPIDNEVGLEAEKQIGFHEHVFLEHHLEGWCPKRGPVRHFMELVCTGLSKNPYLSVERKKRHIMWYKNYFESKQEALKEVGAM
ncbi:small ribosomal subunit protein mS31-like [Palaemon carinicauda]|uniref:small ribosomal subunit protein mS31-like n=1 Tax=Palaemon carinicauda TaxID=392227 RepID=UPI0035B57D48